MNKIISLFAAVVCIFTAACHDEVRPLSVNKMGVVGSYKGKPVKRATLVHAPRAHKAKRGHDVPAFAEPASLISSAERAKFDTEDRASEKQVDVKIVAATPRPSIKASVPTRVPQASGLDLGKGVFAPTISVELQNASPMQKFAKVTIDLPVIKYVPTIVAPVVSRVAYVMSQELHGHIVDLWNSGLVLETAKVPYRTIDLVVEEAPIAIAVTTPSPTARPVVTPTPAEPLLTLPSDLEEAREWLHSADPKKKELARLYDEQHNFILSDPPDQENEVEAAEPTVPPASDPIADDQDDWMVGIGWYILPVLAFLAIIFFMARARRRSKQGMISASPAPAAPELKSSDGASAPPDAAPAPATPPEKSEGEEKPTVTVPENPPAVIPVGSSVYPKTKDPASPGNVIPISGMITRVEIMAPSSLQDLAELLEKKEKEQAKFTRGQQTPKEAAELVRGIMAFSEAHLQTTLESKKKEKVQYIKRDLAKITAALDLRRKVGELVDKLIPNQNFVLPTAEPTEGKLPTEKQA